MRIIPVVRCTDLRTVVTFYTEVLDFAKKFPEASDKNLVVDLVNGAEEHTGDDALGCAINVRVADVDELFKKYVERGLDRASRTESPVHQTPVNQTWSIREFYVTDVDGNTLRFGQQIHDKGSSE